MIRRRNSLAALLTWSLATAPAALAEESIDTTALLASAVDFTCLRILPVGVCVFLDCSLFGCSIETSVKIGHYNPDLVVTPFRAMGQNPWTEMNAVLSPVELAGAESVLSAYAALAGSELPEIDAGAAERTRGTHGQPTDEQREHHNLLYYEVDAVGHPAAAGGYCPSPARPFQPYYLSALDAVAWRWAIPETVYPQAVVPGVREIGHFPANTWGAVYPRSGWVIQPEPPKAAAVTAQRAGDIVTRTGQPHVYTYLGSGTRTRSGGKLVWRPPPLLEGDPKTGVWQRLLPDTGSCEVFGENDTLSATSWAEGKVTETGNYAYTLWRPYTCCQTAGSFLFSVDFLSYP